MTMITANNTTPPQAPPTMYHVSTKISVLRSAPWFMKTLYVRENDQTKVTPNSIVL